MDSILTPVLVLIAWSLVMLFWLYATRIPAMQKAGINPEQSKHEGKAAMEKLPASARWVADNYNHLMEQPTIFYALAFYLQLSGHADSLQLVLAWTYVGLRVVHSVVQATVNVILVRFSIFALSSLVLTGMTGWALYSAFAG
jgi:hypothetical protein